MTVKTAGRPVAGEYAPYYDRYVSYVPDGDIVDVLERQRDVAVNLLQSIDEKRGQHRYEPGKWSVKEVIGHVIDAERVFTYRALAFARGESAPLPSFEQNAWATVSNAHDRSMRSLIEEYRAVRAATIALFRSLTDEAFARSGIASDNHVTVRALAYITAGHERHHLKVLHEKYLQ